MTNPPAYTITRDSITIVWEGKPYTVQSGAPNFSPLRESLLKEAWDEVPNHLTVSMSLKDWARGAFTVRDDTIYYNGIALPSDLNRRIVAMASSNENPSPLFSFWERLQRNPSFRSVKQLWGFLNHSGIPLTQDGCFLAYKSVRDDFKDCHSGKFDNKPGSINEMPRNQISDDPNQACHEGFHVGALEYAQTFSGSRIVVCKIDPEHVVCVPYDSSQQKMRVCRYEVIGNHGSELPSTVFMPDEHDPTADSQEDPELDQMTDVEIIAEFDDDVGDCVKVTTTKKPKKAKSKTSFAKFDKMQSSDLMHLSIEELRRYAGKKLQIVGASKIPGGKVALVSAIMKTRKGVK